MSNATQRLYFTDPYVRSFQAQVLEAAGARVVLDRTGFYPTSGGQPNDLGTIAGVPVLDVIDEDDRIVHVLESPVEPNEVSCVVDWPRRFDHMQQHTGQHLLSAVLADLFGFATVSFHMGAAACTIDLAARELTRDQLETAEMKANSLIHENRPVSATFEDAATVTGLRKPTERKGTIRVVTIDALDRSACGGTHVRATGEIGAILLRSTDKIRGNVRLEFVCGARAVQTARADFNALHRDVPARMSATLERLKDAENAKRKAEGELAGYRGRALYDETSPNERGLRVFERVLPTGPLGDEARSEANSFVAGSKAVYIAVAEEPPSGMLASSGDSGVHCGNVLKPILSEFSGRGGGSATMAQGSFSGDADAFRKRLREAL